MRLFRLTRNPLLRFPMRIGLLIGCGLLIFAANALCEYTPPPSPTNQRNHLVTGPLSSPSVPIIQLTSKERAWLQSHPIIRVLQDPDWPPIEFTGAQGHYQGISSDYLRLIEQRLGIKFRRVSNKNWQEGYQKLKRHEIDMTTSIAVTPENLQFLAFTRPYIKMPIVILTGTDVTYIDNMKELADKQVAVIDCYAVGEWLARDYPQIKLVKVKNATEGIALLRKNKVFAYIDNMLTIGHYMSKLKIYDVKIAGGTPYVSGQSMAVRKDWDILIGILQKALDSVSEMERNTIYQKWVPIRYEQGFNYRLMGQIAVVFVVITMILVIWNRKLSIEIKQRKKAEASLRSAEENYRTLIENAPEAIFVQTREKFVYVNPATLRLYGADSPEQMLGQSVLMITPPEDHDLISKRIQLVNSRRTALPPVDRKHLKLDGTHLDVQVSAVPLFYRGEDSAMVFVMDISMRKRAEEALQKSESRLRFALEGANDALWDMNPHDETFYISPRGCEILGYLPEEAHLLTGRPWQELVHPDHLQITLEQYRAHLMGTTPMFDVAHRLKMKSGDWIWVRTRGKIVSRGPSGLPVRMTGTFTDITERKRAEEENRKLTEQLNQAQKLESIGRLAGGVAHDFNNMLGVILGYAEILKSELEEDEHLSSYVTQIENAATRSQTITQQLLAFSRKQLIAPRPIDINAVIRNSEKMMVRLIGEDIDFQFYPADNLWTVKLDPSQIDQIFINLAVNARDAMPNGGKLLVETANIHVDAFYSSKHFESPPGDYVQLSISDNGIGMDRETVEVIFEPFFTTKEVGKGTGLGLATVYGIVKQNNGFIHVYSEPGQGTTFKIYIPRLDDIAPPLATNSRTAPAQRSDTILLVEDEYMLRQVTTYMLETAGYNVLSAASPLEALPHIENPETKIDLLLTDVVMPGMSGKELGEKARNIRPGLKILFMSGYTTNVIIDQGILQNGAHFIQKPIRRGELIEKIAEILKD